MSCNGFNHPPDCTCGWGGVFHSKSGEHFYGPDFWSREHSHTNPNAHCPVCGALVFFYRSPENGRVFFESLGPPWPKHPCTSRDNRKDRSGASPKGAHLKGWMPFLCVRAYRSKEEGYSAIEDVQGRTLFLPIRSPRIEPDTPIWIRREGEPGHYFVSTLHSKNGATSEVNAHAFRSLSRLHAWSMKRSLSQVVHSDHPLEIVKSKVVSSDPKSAPKDREEAIQRNAVLHLKRTKNGVRQAIVEAPQSRIQGGEELTSARHDKGMSLCAKAPVDPTAGDAKLSVQDAESMRIAAAFLRARNAFKNSQDTS